MTLAEYESRMRTVWELTNLADDIKVKAMRLEERTLKESGLKQHTREPGFPNWCFMNGEGGYFNTPEEALQWKENESKKTTSH